MVLKIGLCFEELGFSLLSLLELGSLSHMS